MKCPKCGYHSFDHLESCKKCGQGLAEHKTKFNLRGFFFPGQQSPAEASEPEPAAAFATAAVSDQGFDFLEDDTVPIGPPEVRGVPDARISPGAETTAGDAADFDFLDEASDPFGSPQAAAPSAAQPAFEDDLDAGFDFLDDATDTFGPSPVDASRGVPPQAVNINLPFAADSETIPADMPAGKPDGGPGGRL